LALKVFHGDDSDTYRFLVSELLPADDIDVVGGAGTRDELLAGVEQTQPDVVLLDQLGGADLIDEIRARVPGVRVVIMSGHHPEDGDPEYPARADGYLVKTADAEAMRAAVRGA
jgi:DNA-binding NarL/FixJ family response regulator